MALPCIGGIAHVWDELAILVRRNSDGTFTLEKESYLPISTYTNAVFFDFNNDGNLDLLIMGQGGDWNVSGDVKIVALYRNLGEENDYRFEKVANPGFFPYKDEGFYNPISVGDYNHDGYTDVVVMNYHEGRRVDLYLNDRGSGTFIHQEQQVFEGATNGSVMFGDLNNDGWLDLEFSGYSDRASTGIKTYINKRDGSFADETPAKFTALFRDNPRWQILTVTEHWILSVPGMAIIGFALLLCSTTRLIRTVNVPIGMFRKRKQPFGSQ